MTSVIGGLANVFGVMPGLLKGTIATASAVGGAVLFAKKMSRGSSPANPVFVSAIGAPGGGGGGGFMGSRTGRVLGGGLGALGLASTIADEGRGYSAGGVLSGAASGAMLGQALIPIPGVGAGIGAVVGGALSYFNNGGGVGGSGPTPIVAHGGEVVVPVTQTPAAENLANMVAQKVSQTAVAQGAPTVQVFIGNEQISDFITKVQNTNLGRPPNLRPVVGV